MNNEVKEILAAASSKGKFTGNQELAYQVGVLAAWIARLSKNDSKIIVEIKQRSVGQRK